MKINANSLKIGNLKEGEFRYLNENEINTLKRNF